MVALVLVATPATVSAQSKASAVPRSAALTALTPENALMVYVGHVTGLDKLMNTIPGKQ